MVRLVPVVAVATAALMAACTSDAEPGEGAGAVSQSAEPSPTDDPDVPSPEPPEPFPLPATLFEPEPSTGSVEVFADPAAGVDPAPWQTSAWEGRLRIEQAHTTRSDETDSGPLTVAVVAGRDAIAMVNNDRHFLGWYLVDAGELGIILDLDGDGGVDYSEVLHDDLTKSWVLSPLGRAFAIATARGSSFGLCAGNPAVDLTGVDVVGLPCEAAEPAGAVSTGKVSVGEVSAVPAAVRAGPAQLPTQDLQDWQDLKAQRSCTGGSDPLRELRDQLGQERVDAAKLLEADLARYGGETVFNVSFFSTYVFEWMKFSPPDKTGNPLKDWLREKAIEEFGGEKGVEKLQTLTDSEILRLASRTLSDFKQESADTVAIKLALAGAPKRTCDERDPGGQTKTGNGGGDPHLRTFDGLSYSYQGVGDYTLLASDDGSFEVQARTRGIGTAVSAFDTIAVRLDDAVVRFELAEKGRKGGRFVVVSGPGGLDVSESRVTLRDGSSLEVTQRGPSLSVSIDLSPVWQGRVTGWLGDADGSPDDDLAVRATDEVASVEDLYTAWGESWRVDKESSFLPYGAGEGPEDYHDRSFPSAAIDIDDDVMADARRRCAVRGVLVEPDVSQCAFDFAVTEDEAFIDSAAARARANGQTTSVPTAPIVELTPDVGSGFGIIEGYGRWEVWRLKAKAGERLEVLPLHERFVDCSIGPWNLAARAWFAGPTGAVLGEGGSLANNCSRFGLVLEPKRSGEVLLVVSGQQLLDARAQGPYGLAVHRAESDQTVTVTAPFDTDEKAGFGRFETAGSVERFRFTAEKGDDIHIQPRTVDGAPCAIGPGPGYVLQLFDPDRRPLVEGSSPEIDGEPTWYWTNNCAFTRDEPVVITAPRGGIYELAVASRPVFASSRTGTYSIRVALDPADLQ